MQESATDYQPDSEPLDLTTREGDAPTMTRGVTLLMAVTVGMLVANLQYMQPLLQVMADGLGLSESQVGSAAAAALVAQTLTMLLILPLGDIYERKGLILASTVASIVVLLLLAASNSFWWLMGASVGLGLATFGTHMTVSLAASLAPPEQQGRVVGTVISGLLTGILAARVFGGVAGAYIGWRMVYVLAAAGLVVLLVVLWYRLPSLQPQTRLPYPHLLGSMWTLWRTQPVLREACLFGAMTFGGFSAFWLTLAFHLERPPFNYGSQVVGLMGVFALVGALAATGVGWLADRLGARRITGWSLLVTTGSFGLLWALGWKIWGIALGVVIMDLGVQAVHVCNQTRVYALVPGARNRLGTIYMVTYLGGGSIGAALAIWGWARMGWTGVCLVGGGMSLLAVGHLLMHRPSSAEVSESAVRMTS